MSVPVVKVSVLTTPPSLKLKLLPKPVVQVKMLSRFPANVAAISPVLLDRTGGNYTFSIDLNEIIANLPPAGVSSVFGRSGAVTAQSGDYTFAQIGSTPTTLLGYGITDAQPLDSDLTALATNSANGLWARTGSGTGAARTITAPAAGITVSNGDGVSGNPTLALANDLSALEGLSSTGLAARTGTDAWAQRTITGPAAGITVTNGNGVSGNPTLALANDLSALEGLSSTGIAVRTTTDTWAQRTITGTANAISVTNGDGVSGNPTLAISTDAALPGNPTTTTQAVDNSTTRVATTAYVVGQAAAATPLGNAATAVVGTSTRFARADHVHPGREQLTAARTYYVRTDGSNSNNGLANTSGGAFLTIQKAIDVVAALDISIYNVTIQVAAGTYTGAISVTGPWIGSGTVFLIGDVSTPSNVLLNVTGNAIVVSSGGRLAIGGFKIQSTGIGLASASGAAVNVTNPLEFGTNTSYCAFATNLANLTFNANFTVSGSGGVAAMAAGSVGALSIAGVVCTVSGTPAFSVGFAYSDFNSFLAANSFTFSGSGATGPRYNVARGSTIFTGGGGASYFPGNAAGVGTNFGASPYGLYA